MKIVHKKTAEFLRGLVDRIQISDEQKVEMREAIEQRQLKVLRAFFAARPNVGRKVYQAATEHVFEFVETEIRRLKEKKDATGLSREDEEFARSRLMSLLEGVEKICLRAGGLDETHEEEY